MSRFSQYKFLKAPRPVLVLSAVLLLTTALRPATATAQDESPTSDTSKPKLTIEEEVEVEGEAPKPPSLAGIERRLPTSDRKTPVSLSSVDPTLLSDQGALTLSDALLNVPGVNVQTGSGPFDQWTVRGLDGLSSSLVLSDGSVEPESTMMHLYNVDRVEVLRGAGGFLYGGRAMAGTINLVRKRPAKGDFVHLGLLGGSHGLYEGTVDANWQIDDHSGFRLNGLWRTADNFRDDNELDVAAINPSWAWKDAETTLGVHFEFVSNELTPDSGLPIVSGSIPAVPRDRSYSAPFDRSEQEVIRFQINLEEEISDTLTWRTKAYYNSIDWQSEGTLFTGTFDLGFTALAFRAQSALDDKQDFYGVLSEFAWTVETGSVTHDILVGVELARHDDDFRFDVFNLPQIDVFQPVETATAPGFPFPGQSRFGNVSAEVLAPFFFDRISFNDVFQVVLGARWDSIEMDASGTSSARDDEQASPLLGVVVSPSDAVTLYANYAESFEPQSTLVVGQLEPEEGEQVEAGVKLGWLGGKVRADLAWFELDKSRVAIPDFTGFPSQSGSLRSEGIELELLAALGDDFDLRFAFAHTESEYTEFRELVVFGTGPTDFFVADRAGSTVPWAPENLANLWLSKRFGSLQLGFGARWVDDQFIAADNSFEVDGYNLFDAAVSYTFDRLQLHLNLFNLGDEEYETRAFAPGAVVPAPGFEAQLGLRYLL
ncbi:MAG: TonB-dependent siderophore receptor [Thermoanaerobaculia bacterium]|nr:TonB-dependent siderophore receptor [Thermoanaerobaculia bacterium]